MFTLELTREERDMLIQVLESSLDDVRMQLIAADNMMYKMMLRKRKEAIAHLLEELRKEEQLPLAE
ncbi:hypothetical protein BECAL_03097 [Bellilinea caldifistulae]|uniref:50S ribosomal protein L29 n=1 Tax=Bellilinea caldifistulae TaxID=360411 RepID=A0A0P6Y3R3_9CHLR|nr:hypothetical protein [Bellilinea caldifistulae]KPL76245.1 hypothetical protein AC812_06040 [Bellilinea caldifistulae]GAP11902.1 hypothetical protein BECAL_03097 [Bellilinea caldifistulae]